MTEHEWLTSEDPQRMLGYVHQKEDNLPVRRKLSDRKLRFFVVRGFFLRHPLAQKDSSLIRYAHIWIQPFLEGKQGGHKVSPEVEAWATVRKDMMKKEDRSALADLLREIVGNPFQRHWLCSRGAFSPCQCDSIRNPVVTVIARSIYDEESFQDCPILADALEDAGCSNTHLLSHLRGPNTHFRGCFALDAVLGGNDVRVAGDEELSEAQTPDGRV